MPIRPPIHRVPMRESRVHRPVDHRVSSWYRGYDAHWRKLRLVVLAEEPLCRECKAGGRLVTAKHVDHHVPLADGGTHDRGNLVPLCHSCHSRKTAREDGGFGHRKVK